MPNTNFNVGQRVWYKGRSVTYLYALHERAAVIRDEGASDTKVVRRDALSPSPPRAADDSGAAN